MQIGLTCSPPRPVRVRSAAATAAVIRAGLGAAAALLRRGRPLIYSHKREHDSGDIRLSITCLSTQTGTVCHSVSPRPEYTSTYQSPPPPASRLCITPKNGRTFQSTASVAELTFHTSVPTWLARLPDAGAATGTAPLCPASAARRPLAVVLSAGARRPAGVRRARPATCAPFAELEPAAAAVWRRRPAAVIRLGSQREGSSSKL